MRKPTHTFVRLTLTALCPALLLTACGSGDDGKEKAGSEDGAMSAALGDEIMVDPDLAGQNNANSAVSAGLRDGSLPPEARTDEAISRARAEALKLVGGSGKLLSAPEAMEVSGSLPAEAALTAAARAAAAPGGEANCADKAEYTMKWAAKLPKTFPVYPRGAVQEAAGTDDGACNLRVVNFVSAVPLNTVLDFYYTRATQAGFSTQRVREGEDDILGGVKGKASYVIYFRKLASGSTEVDLITNAS